MPTRETLSIAEAAEVSGSSPAAVKAWTRRGNLTPIPGSPPDDPRYLAADILSLGDIPSVHRDKPTYMPTPDEIRRGCEAIQREWTTEERDRRRVWRSGEDLSRWEVPILQLSHRVS